MAVALCSANDCRDNTSPSGIFNNIHLRLRKQQKPLTWNGLPTSSFHILITKSRYNFCHVKVGFISLASNLIQKENVKLGYEISKMCCHQLSEPPWDTFLYVFASKKNFTECCNMVSKIYVNTVYKLEGFLQTTLILIDLWRHGLNCYKRI